MTITAELSQDGNAIVRAADVGTVDDTVRLSIAGGDTLLVESPEGVTAGPGFTAIDANSASAPLTEIVGGEIRVSMFDGDDLVAIESSPNGILTLADTGDGSDEVRVGTEIAGLDGLIGALELAGGDHGSGETELTIKDDTNSLATGDRLTIFDAAALLDHEYEMSDVAFERTTLGAETAQLQFASFESIDVETTLGATIMDITGTPASSRVTITTHDGEDQMTIEDTGQDSNVVVATAGGSDSILIRDTGEDGGTGATDLGSFVAVDAGDGADQITLERNGDTTRVQLSGGAAADEINIVSTAVDSVTLVLAGSGSDTINVSSNAPASGHLDNIQGQLCIDGQNHDLGSELLTIKGDDNQLDSGDVVNLSDALATFDHFYSLTASTFRRSTLTNPTALVEYQSIETLNIETTEGEATVLIAGTAPAVNTNLTTQDAIDRIAIEDTGDDSNVTIVTGGGDDVVGISDTGGNGSVGSFFGSFLRVRLGDGLDSSTLEGNGIESRVLIEGQSGADMINVQATSERSVTLVEAGSGSDTINVSSNGSASGSLDGIQGGLCIDGQDHGVGDVTLSIKGDDNSLESGDVLNISDAAATRDHVYSLTASSMTRTTLAEPTGRMEYLAIETLNLETTQGEATILATSTADATNTNVTTQDAADLIGFNDTGADSNLVISTGGGDDSVRIQDTGGNGGAGNVDLGSFVRVAGGDGNDFLLVDQNGVGSRVELDGQGGADQLRLVSTAVDSVTLVQGGTGSDTVELAPGGVLDGIQGRVCVDGQAHDAGDTTLAIGGDQNTLDSGDRLNIFDPAKATSQSYQLTESVFRRTTLGESTADVEYQGIETLDVITTSLAQAIVVVSNTAPATNTNISTGDGMDLISMLNTGADSNVTISTGNEADSIEISDTGEDGGAGAAGLGSFVRVSEGQADGLFNLAGNGVASRIQFLGAEGDDSIYVRATSVESAMVVEGGAGNDDTIVSSQAPASGTLSGIQGLVRVDGQDHDASDVFTTSIKVDDNTLALGDSLQISDALEAEAQSYELTAGTFQRTTSGDSTAMIHYSRIEDLQVATTEGAADFVIAATAPQSNLRIVMQEADDRLEINDTGADSNVVVRTAGGADDVVIRDTGEDGGAGAADRGSFLTVSTDDGQDTIALEGNGAGSRVLLQSEDDADVINVRGTSTNSENVIEAGLGSDVVNIAPLDLNLDAIQGRLCVFGGGHEEDDQTTLMIKGDTNTLATGDVINVSDAGSTDMENYLLDANLIGRGNAGLIDHQEFESLNITTTQGVADIFVDNTFDETNTTLTTQDADDIITVGNIGNGGNLVVSAGAGNDSLEMGFDSDGAIIDSGSFLQVNAGPGDDTIELVLTGDRGRIRLSGEDGADQIFVRSSTETSLTVVEGGAGNDVIDLGTNVPTRQLLGDVCVDGGGQDPLGREIVRTGQVVPGIPYTPESRFVYEGPVAIDVGDTLNISNQLMSEGHDYVIDANSVTRDSDLIAEYQAIETINLRSGTGNDQLTVEYPTSADVIAFDAGGQTEVDRLIVRGDDSSNQIRVDTLQADGSVRSPLEIEGVELIQVHGGSSLATDNDTMINDTGVPALLLGEGGDDVHVGGTGTDVAIGGPGIDAMFGNTGDDFLVPDVSLLSVDFESSVSTQIEINPVGGDLIFGNLGDGNDLGAFDEAVALVPPGSQADFVDEVELLIEEGAVKGVWSWLLARFPEPSESSIQELVDRAISRLLSEAGADSLSSMSSSPAEVGESEPIAQTMRFDVNGDGSVSPIDALLIINQLNQAAISAATIDQQAVDRMMDLNGDGQVSPIDALQIINHLNEPSPTRHSPIGSDYAAAILALDDDDV